MPSRLELQVGRTSTNETILRLRKRRVLIFTSSSSRERTLARYETITRQHDRAMQDAQASPSPQQGHQSTETQTVPFHGRLSMPISFWSPFYAAFCRNGRHEQSINVVSFPASTNINPNEPRTFHPAKSQLPRATVLPRVTPTLSSPAGSRKTG